MDDIVTPYAPTPGSTQVGDLYADLQTRTLWLGVNTAVDPSGSVLISDIVSLQEEIAEAEADANAYTNAQVALRAPINHTHVASQITDFTAAVTAVTATIPGLKFNRGTILMYYGSSADIGVGNWAGWALCDGLTPGTPDLRDRFIFSTGTIHETFGPNTPVPMVTGENGGHTPVIQNHTLTLAQTPSHTHTVTGSCTGTTGYENVAHTHSTTIPYGNVTAETGGGGLAGSLAALTSYNNAQHVHGFTGTISGTAAAQGGGGAHGHTASPVPAHSHNITTQILRQAIPYFALAFVMKL